MKLNSADHTDNYCVTETNTITYCYYILLFFDLRNQNSRKTVFLFLDFQDLCNQKKCKFLSYHTVYSVGNVYHFNIQPENHISLKHRTSDYILTISILER